MRRIALVVILGFGAAGIALAGRQEEILSIQAGTQAHLKGIRIAVGNIWEESYTPEGGEPTRGLTAMLAIGLPGEASRTQRVHPGHTLRTLGYTIRVLAIEAESVRLGLTREPDSSGHDASGGPNESRSEAPDDHADEQGDPEEERQQHEGPEAQDEPTAHHEGRQKGPDVDSSQVAGVNGGFVDATAERRGQTRPYEKAQDRRPGDDRRRAETDEPWRA